jgi:hypothetical protein
MEDQKNGDDPAAAAAAPDLDALGMACVETGKVPRSASERTYKRRGPGHALSLGD